MAEPALPSGVWSRRRTSASRKPVALGAAVAVPILSVDAAAACGAALVYPRQRASQCPRLAQAWGWRNTSYEAWCRSMEACIVEALQLCEQHGHRPPLFVVERSEGAVRAKSRGGDMFQGIGRRQGLALAEWRHARPKASRVGLLVRQSWWTRALNLTTGKKNGGGHRLAEARTVLVGAAAVLREVTDDFRVDAAEAAHQGAAVSLYGGDL